MPDLPMTLARFHSALRIMLNLDRHELVEAGALEANDAAGWWTFSQDHFMWLIRAPDAQAEALWTIIERRMR